jgi:hypothetical protein
MISLSIRRPASPEVVTGILRSNDLPPWRGDSGLVGAAEGNAHLGECAPLAAVDRRRVKVAHPAPFGGITLLKRSRILFFATVLYLVSKGRTTYPRQVYGFRLPPSASPVPGDAVGSRGGDAARTSRLSARSFRPRGLRRRGKDMSVSLVCTAEVFTVTYPVQGQLIGSMVERATGRGRPPGRDS